MNPMWPQATVVLIFWLAVGRAWVKSGDRGIIKLWRTVAIVAVLSWLLYMGGFWS